MEPSLLILKTHHLSEVPSKKKKYFTVSMLCSWRDFLKNRTALIRFPGPVNKQIEVRQ